MGVPFLLRPLLVAALALPSLAACDDAGDGPSDGGADAGALGSATPVDFAAPGALAAREAVCDQDFDNPAHIGSGAELRNATHLWPSSPYLVLLPASGRGYVTLDVDVAHVDWLIYLQQGAGIESSGAPAVEHNGALARCPELGLEEHGAHHDVVTSWPLELTGEPGTRVELYAFVAATDHTPADALDHVDHADATDDDAGTAP